MQTSQLNVFKTEMSSGYKKTYDPGADVSSVTLFLDAGAH
jgi:hypothetical protein